MNSAGRQIPFRNVFNLMYVFAVATAVIAAAAAISSQPKSVLIFRLTHFVILRLNVIICMGVGRAERAAMAQQRQCDRTFFANLTAVLLRGILNSTEIAN